MNYSYFFQSKPDYQPQNPIMQPLPINQPESSVSFTNNFCIHVPAFI